MSVGRAKALSINVSHSCFSNAPHPAPCLSGHSWQDVAGCAAQERRHCSGLPEQCPLHRCHQLQGRRGQQHDRC